MRESIKERRFRRYPLGDLFIFDLMELLVAGSAFRFRADWPHDTEFYRAYHDMLADTIWVVVTSNMFDRVDEGAVIPEGPPIECTAYDTSKHDT